MFNHMSRAPLTEYNRIPVLHRILKVLLCLLVCKVVAGVVLSYRDYAPPNFESEFLQGRSQYFSGSYAWAFYAHVTSGPSSLVLGMILVSERFRRRFTKWHRYLGRIQVGCVLLFVAPSGLWMARFADSGAVAGCGFAALAVATGFCAALGWRSAVRRQFDAHRLWMWRCFLLLCSAVVLRLMGGLTRITGTEATWSYPLAAWISWLLPLLAFEVIRYAERFMGLSEIQQAAPEG
jgi:hypothetical protein